MYLFLFVIINKHLICYVFVFFVRFLKSELYVVTAILNNSVKFELCLDLYNHFQEFKDSQEIKNKNMPFRKWLLIFEHKQ